MKSFVAVLNILGRAIVAAALAFSSLSFQMQAGAIETNTLLPLKVAGNHIVDSHGEPVLLRGVNAASMEWSSDGQGHIVQTVTTAIRDWHVNLIRLPLSQDRWFGKGPEQANSYASYRALVRQIVDLCVKAGDLKTARILFRALQTPSIKADVLNDHPVLRP